MHILILPSWYPINENEIHGIFFREQANALGKVHEVGLIYPYFISLNNIFKFSEIKSNLIAEEQIYFETDVYINFYPKIKKLFLKNWISKGMRLFERYIFKKGMPDIIHVHSMIPAGMLALKIKEKYGIPFVLTEHSSRYFLDEKNIDKNCHKIIKEASYLSAVSGSYADYLQKKTHNNWGIIPNFIHENFFNENIENKNKEIVFSSISFLNKNKNTIMFLKAIREIKDRIRESEFKQIKFVIAGDGPELVNLKRYASENFLEDSVDFKGHVSRSEVLKLLSLSTALVLCSQFETFSVICAEAHAIGKPVISTKCSGPEYFINSNNGFLINKNDYNELADCILKFIQNRFLFDVKEIKRNCRDQFSEEAVIKLITEIFHNIVDSDES
ncbi:glycosyltransferase [Acinetobacter indicus]|uniref:glycosyltransferase n=1 Tax=Acinetobacter indicus TaxID=756892 RepID=UPI00257807AF|nr:glycosyltransferase [Acinetobacter indicus]MDM1263168.1 glycosyltransferase [Acinetobacter indicus]